jgi:cytoskeletal protein RodZ
MNGFIKKSIGTLTLGEKLKKLRSERRISLGEVSKHTRIQVKYLEYLEEGRYEKLPVDVYVRGFLKNYADFLAIDANVLIRLYEKEREIKKNLEKGKNSEEKPTLPVPFKISSFALTPKIILISAIAVVTFGGFFYLYKEIGAFASVPRLIISNPEKNTSVSGNSIIVEGVTDKDAKLYINGQLILVNDDGKFRENLTLQSGNNSINIRAVNRFGKEETAALTVQSNYQKEEEEKKQEGSGNNEITQSKGVEIEVRVDPGPVWLSIEADGNLVFSGTMLTGAIQTFRAEEKISVNSGKDSATFIKFNGKEIGALGESGNPVRGVVFTPDTAY